MSMSNKLHQRIQRLEKSSKLSQVPVMSKNDLIAHAKEIIAAGVEGIESTPQLSNRQIYRMAQEFLLQPTLTTPLPPGGSNHDTDY
jgi:predicted transcriptional regulator